MASNRSELDVAVQGTDQLSPTLDQLQSRLIRFVGFVSSAMTAIKIAGFPVDAVRSFEKEMANVAKTTNFSSEQIKTLGDQIVDLSRNINVSATDLAKIAAAAGQQGLGREGVAGVYAFTESVSRMSSVLDVTVEQAGTDIGKIASIFKVPMADIEKAVSTFNQVSNNSTASGEQLLDVVKRIGDAAGSLDLAKSTAIAATGVDLGFSPEVVGSSFQKIFSEMYGRAQGFQKLLGGTVTDWIKNVQNDGLGALKQYVAALRKLAPDVQQQQIKMLSGGGRIGSVLTKLVQDTEDTILDRNYAQALKGFEGGTSAIREQQTVLATLDAQIVQAGNSFQALGIKAGEVFGPRLTAYFAQLNKQLANPEIVKFAEAVGSAFLDLFDSVVQGIKYINSLNLNWYNFITLAKVFLGLKLVQSIASMAAKIPILGTAWQSLAGQAAAAGDAQAAAGGAGASALQVQVNRVKELIAQHRAYQTALKEEAAFSAQVAQNEAKLAAAQVKRENMRGLENQGKVAIVQAGTAVTAAKQGVSAAQSGAAASQAAVQAQLNARLEQAEQQHVARMQAIEAERIRLQSIARADGDRAALLAATRARDAQLVEEDAYYSRSLAGINSYYARRLRTVTEAGAAEVAAANAALMASLSAFDGVAAGVGMTALQANSAAAAAAVGKATVNLDASRQSLTLAQRAAVLAGEGFSILGTGVKLASAAFTGFMAIATKFFFWATIIYTALEALGITGKIASGFQALTDKLGITSQASRDAAAAQEKLAQQLAEVATKAKDAQDAIKKYTDETGRLSKASLSAFDSMAAGGDRDAYLTKYKELIQLTDDYNKVLATQKEQQSRLADPASKETVQKQVDDQQKVLDKAKADLARKQATPAQIDGPYGIKLDSEGSKASVAAAQADVAAQQAIMDKLQTSLARFSQDNLDSLGNQIKGTEADLTALQQRMASTLTPESQGIVDTYFDKLVAAQEAQAKAEAARKDTVSALDVAGKRDSGESEDVVAARVAAAKEANTVATDQVDAANRTVDEIKKQVTDAIAALKESGGLAPAVVGSLDALQSLLGFSKEAIAAVNTGVKAAEGKNLAPDGKLAGPAKGAASGTDRVDSTTASEEKRRRQAELAITKAGLEAQANLQKEYNSQINDDNEDAYKQNIRSIKDYYAERLKLQKANLDIEINLAKQNLGALGTEMSAARGKDDEQNKTAATQKANPPKDGSATVQPADGSEVMRIQAQIVQAQGQVKLLEVQKAALDKDNERALRDAEKEFTNKVADQKAALIEFFGTGDSQVAFNSALQQAQQGYKDFVDRLTAESKTMPELLPLIDQIKLEGQFKAVQAAIDATGAKAEIANGYLDITASRIQALGAAGVLTNAQVSGLEEANREQIIKTKEAQNQADQERLDALVAQQGAAAATTLEYQKMQLAIDQRSGEIANLKVQGNTVATDLNKSLHNSIQQGLIDLTDPTKSFGDAIVDFFTSVVNSLRDKAAEGIADTVMQAIGSTGSSGWGGFWSDLLGSSSKTVGNSGTGANALAASTSVANTSNLLNGTASATGTGDLLASVGLGSTAATPLYVTDAATALAGGTGSAASGLGDITRMGDPANEEIVGTASTVADKGFFTSAFDSLTSGISDMASSVASGITGVGSSIVGGLSSGISSIMSFLSPLFSSLIAVISGSSATSGLSGAASAGLAVGAAAHNGGIAGRTTMRRTGVSAAAFNGAVRYHTGGKAGLAPNEVPVILEKGEEVLTQDDPRHQDNLSKSGSDGSSSGGSGNTNFTVQPVLSESAVLDAMKGSKGQKMLLVHIGNNPAGFRAAMGIKG